MNTMTFGECFSSHLDAYKNSVLQETENMRRGVYHNHIISKIGSKPIVEIKVKDIMPVFRELEKQGKLKTLWVAHNIISQVFDYSIVILEVCEHNPAYPIRRFLPKYRHNNHPFLLESEMPEFFNQVRMHGKLSLQARVAFLLIAYTAVRNKEAMGAKWEEFDFKSQLWSIPASRMKMRREHLVPLSSQVINLLLWWKEQSKSDSDYVFPAKNKRNKNPFMIGNCLSQAILKTSFDRKQTVHGLRHRFSTTANEAGLWRGDAIEYCLAHKSSGVKAVYNKARYLNERKKIMGWYADNYVSIWAKSFILEK